MTVRRVAPVDAQMYWMAGSVPNDQFLVYAFAGGPADKHGADAVLQVILRRARDCAGLGVRVADRGFWQYPVWEPEPVGAESFEVHELPDPCWAACLAAVADLGDDQLDPRLRPWRLHVFPQIGDIPGAGRGVVVVLQIAHALGDGQRSSAFAAHLFGRDGAIPHAVADPHPGFTLPLRAVAAARAHRALVRETGAGLVPGQAHPRPTLRSNARPAGSRMFRAVVCERARLPGPTVTVAALAAVSTALSAHLRELGDDPSQLGAEVPMARTGPRRANNHFGNVGVGLYPLLAGSQRRAAIAADLAARRRRAAHPAMRAESSAFAAVPAPLLRWGVSQFDPTVRSESVTGNTVVSSVNRGAPDLRFGPAPVVLTAGFPGLSPMMGLTHGVHGIGGTVVISVHAAESAIGDIDAYVERLEYELQA